VVLASILASFEVYRTYIQAGAKKVGNIDRDIIAYVVLTAQRQNRVISRSAFHLVQNLLLLNHPEGLNNLQITERKEFVMQLQQLTGPVMAKGIEDTAFYRYAPLASVNEVGSHLGAFATTPDLFHQNNLQRLTHSPHSLLATSTHDTKRSEDVRLRIAALSEIPKEWNDALQRWAMMNDAHKTALDDDSAPTTHDEYFFYQTVVGTYDPTSRDHTDYIARLQQTMEKATKEAKLRTSWINPDEAYDEAVRTFVERTLEPSKGNLFHEDLATFLPPIREAAAKSSLAQVVLKVASPGVADFYQGCENFTDSLVDPDNRRPVDFKRLHRLLSRAQADIDNEGIKLFITQRALELRRRQPALFLEGEYIPLKVVGAHADNAIAFARTHQDQSLLALVGRFFLKSQAWEATSIHPDDLIPKGVYRDIFTDVTIEIGSDPLLLNDLLVSLPVTLLERIAPCA